jgi:hypothetical protein
MKRFKFLTKALAVVLLGLATASCGREPISFESTNSRIMEQEVYWNQWDDYVDGDVQYKYVTFDWNAISTDVLNYGTVNAYVYETDAVGTHQCPLPYSFPILYTDDNGVPFFVPTNFRYILEPGKITFIREDLDGGAIGSTMDYTAPLTFRAVATVPVQYTINN